MCQNSTPSKQASLSVSNHLVDATRDITGGKGSVRRESCRNQILNPLSRSMYQVMNTGAPAILCPCSAILLHG
jgi:hypothetical protein